MTGVLPTGDNTAGMIDINKYQCDDGRVWSINKGDDNDDSN